MILAITHQGVTKPAADWGVTVAGLSMLNLGVDTLRLTVRGTSTPAWAFGDRLSLSVGGVRRFQGYISARPKSGRGAGVVREFVVSGPMWQLDRCPYLADRKTLGRIVDLDEPQTPAPEILQSSRVVLGMGADIRSRLTNGQQIAALMTYAQDAYGLDVAAGDIEADYPIPFEDATDISIGEAIRRVMRWTYDAVGWWDYAPATPVFHVRRRAALTAKTIDLAATNLVTEWSCAPREDQVPTGVAFVYEIPTTTVIGDETVQWVMLYTETAGAPLGTPGFILHTIQLAGASYGEPYGEPVPRGACQQFYDSLATVGHEGTLVLKERDVTFAVQLGETVSLLGDDLEFGAMSALVQVADYDLARGETRITFGPPDHLGAADWKALLALNRTRIATSDFATTRDNGIPPGPPNPRPPSPPPPRIPDDPAPPTPFNPQPYIEIELCNPERTVRVPGYPV